MKFIEGCLDNIQKNKYVIIFNKMKNTYYQYNNLTDFIYYVTTQ